MNVKDAFMSVYERNINASTETAYGAMKRVALEKTLEEVPEARQHLELWRQITIERRGAVTPDEMLGAELMAGMSNVIQAYRRKTRGTPTRVRKAASPVKVVENETPTNGTGTSVIDRLAVWLMDHEYVASDQILAHFTGLSRASFSNARARLKDKGYDFDPGPNNGWMLKSKPVAAAPAVNGHALPAGLSPHDLQTLLKLAKAFSGDAS